MTFDGLHNGIMADAIAYDHVGPSADASARTFL